MWKILPRFSLLFGIFLVFLDGKVAEKIKNGIDAASDEFIDVPPYKNVIIDIQPSNFHLYLQRENPKSLLDMDMLPMGKRTDCDNGRMGIKIDFDPFDKSLNHLYTCRKHRKIVTNNQTKPHLILYKPARGYRILHKCMDTSIEYIERIPTIGPHRPLWAVFGEYTYLPVQRWLHNIEHGSIVMLYHPCADDEEVEKLRKIVKNCIYRHIITPYTLLTRDRPLALATWGASLEMSKVDEAISKYFIQQHALQGPERTSKNGQYSLMIIHRATIVSDVADTDLCPRQRKPTFFIEE